MGHKKHSLELKTEAVRLRDTVVNNGIVYKANKASVPSQTFNPVNWDVFIPDEKFKRNSESMQTTVSTLPTYEPCPEHDAFTTVSIAGYKPIITADDSTFQGSAGSGNSLSTPPAASVNPGSTNTSIQGDPSTDSSISKDININAFRCQLSIHEGIKNKSYADTKGLTTGGIGHLLRTNELALYPVGTPISTDQIETWYIQDSISAIKIAQQLFPDVWSDLSDIRKRAIADLAYNMGKAGLSKFVNFIAAINAQDFNKAGMSLADSAWFKQVGRRGPNIVTMVSQNVDPNGCDKKFPE